MSKFQILAKLAENNIQECKALYEAVQMERPFTSLEDHKRYVNELAELLFLCKAMTSCLYYFKSHNTVWQLRMGLGQTVSGVAVEASRTLVGDNSEYLASAMHVLKNVFRRERHRFATRTFGGSYIFSLFFLDEG